MIEFIIASSIILPVIMLCVAAQFNNGSNPYYYITRGQLILYMVFFVIPFVNWIFAIYLFGLTVTELFDTKTISAWLKGHPFRKG